MNGLHPDDGNVTRFLWPKNYVDSKSPIKIYRFIVVLFGTTFSKFFLNATVRYYLEKHSGEMSKLILINIYIDNVF